MTAVETREEQMEDSAEGEGGEEDGGSEGLPALHHTRPNLTPPSRGHS